MTPSHPADPEAKPERYVIKKKIEPMYSEHFKARAKEEAAMDAAAAAGTDTPETDAAWQEAMQAPVPAIGPILRNRMRAVETRLAQAEADRNALRGQVERLQASYQIWAVKWEESQAQLAAANAALEEARRERNHWEALLDEQIKISCENVRKCGEAMNEADSLRAQLDAAKKAGDADRKRFDWLTLRLEDVSVGEADPTNHMTEMMDWPEAWRRAIDAARSASTEDGK